ncbi:UNVERIFIED_CONTAM: hypothetical protein Slati_2409500 [Sesamum latifolium]|uniref:Retrotransposon gag domain-containing protein n=1 Tax=Sesamum latifolium TaxID=2727402 RepID=A0AAW2WDA8_9LAMI
MDLEFHQQEYRRSLVYIISAKDLWLKLESRFGESNRPLLYQINRKISILTQGDTSVVVYCTKLKKLWDELACLNPLPICSSSPSRELVEQIMSSQLIQLFMGLSTAYEHVRNQILLLEPLPTVGKAYSMVLRVEKQKEVHGDLPGNLLTEAMNVKGKQNFRRGIKDKRNQYCDHCKRTDHLLIIDNY